MAEVKLPVKAYIGFGTNLGDRKENLDRAIEMLRRTEGIAVTEVSSYYETEPVGYKEQPNFLNAAAELTTVLSPEALLQACSAVERELKRERTIRWGPRTIDLDILLFGDLVLESPDLTIPHPRMHEREFVLTPLFEIAPEAIHPILKKSIGELRQALIDS